MALKPLLQTGFAVAAGECVERQRLGGLLLHLRGHSLQVRHLESLHTHDASAWASSSPA